MLAGADYLGNIFMVGGMVVGALPFAMLAVCYNTTIVGIHSTLLSATIKIQRNMDLDWVETNKLLVKPAL